MSVKFEKDSVKTTVKAAATEVGTALTGGKGGPNGYLAVCTTSYCDSAHSPSKVQLADKMKAYLAALQKNPLRTKMLTSGALSGLQELLASFIAKDRNKSGSYFTSRVPKMAANGAFVMAPVSHVLITLLQKVFAGRTSLKAKILQILVSNLFVSTTCV